MQHARTVVCGGSLRRRVQHQHKFAAQALRTGRQPGDQISRRQGGYFFKLLGLLAPHRQSPLTQRCKCARQRFHAVRRFQKNHGALFAQQFQHSLVTRFGFVG